MIYLVKFLNPNYHKFRVDYYRHSFSDSILNESFSLIESEKRLINLVKSELENKIYFEFLDKKTELEKVYKKYRKGITEKEIKNLVYRICDNIKLNKKFLKTIVYNVGDSFKSPLGYFQPKGNIGGTIAISINKYYDIKILLAIIIHECMHYFMHVYNLNFGAHNEYATDLIAVYLGFGKYMIEGYQTITIIDKQFLPGFRNLTVGYLTEKQLAYVERMYHY